MTACLGKSCCSFGLPCVYYLNFCQSVCVLLSLLVLTAEVGFNFYFDHFPRILVTKFRMYEYINFEAYVDCTPNVSFKRHICLKEILQGKTLYKGHEADVMKRVQLTCSLVYLYFI